MYITIVTKYHPASYIKGSRISASNSDGKRIIISYPDNAPGGNEGAHFQAVKAFCKKMGLELGWNGKVVCGELKPGTIVWNFICKDESNVYLVS